MIDVIKQMVEALEWSHGGEPIGTADAITAGKKLIAELESQEPVAWMCSAFDGEPCEQSHHDECENPIPLYAHPPQRTEQKTSADDFFKMIADRNPKPFRPTQRTWVGLTNEEVKAFDTWHDNREEEVGWCNPSEIVAYIEAKLKEKNNA